MHTTPFWSCLFASLLAHINTIDNFIICLAPTKLIMPLSRTFYFGHLMSFGRDSLYIPCWPRNNGTVDTVDFSGTLL